MMACSYQDSRRDAENLRQFDRAGEVAAIIRHAAEEEEGVTAVQVDHMAPELNRLHLQAVWEASREADIEIGLIAYILVPITLNGEMVSYSKRAHSTFYHHGKELGGDSFEEHIRQDEDHPLPPGWLV